MPPSQEVILQASHLSKRVSDAIGTLTILDDITLSIKQGETVAIVGASGSGKSTLLGLLAGLDSATSGSIRLCGEELSSLDEDGRARLRAEHVGFVFQSFQLLPHLNAIENVMLPLELRGDGNAYSKASGMLDKVGLSQRQRHYPKPCLVVSSSALRWRGPLLPSPICCLPMSPLAVSMPQRAKA